MSGQLDQVDPTTMAEMRAWAKECTWREAEDYGETSPEYIDSLTDEEVLHGVDQHYPGGSAGFARDWS